MLETAKKLDKRTGSLSKDNLGNSYLRNLDKIAQVSGNRSSALLASASQLTKQELLQHRMRRVAEQMQSRQKAQISMNQRGSLKLQDTYNLYVP